MTQYLAFALIGLGVGSFYAALATGLVVTYRGTGVINFAAGAMASWSVYVYDELRKTGDLVLPWLGLPNRLDLGATVGFWPAFALGVASGAVVGAVAHIAVFRPLRTAPALAKVVATVGLLLASQALIVRNFGPEPRQVGQILPNGGIPVGDLTVPRDRLIIAAVAVAATAAVGAYFRYTRVGLATLAGAEDEQAIASARFSPDLLAAVAWALASALTGAVLILASPLTVVNPVTFTLAILPALVAVIVARLDSLTLALVVGFALGSLDAMVSLASLNPWWPGWAQVGATEALQFLVLAGTLFVIGRSLPERGAAQVDPLPAVYRPQNRPGTVATLSLVAVAAVVFTSGSYRFGVVTSMIVAIVALSLVVLTGLVGQISLAQAAFAGTSGFILARVDAVAGLPFPLPILVSAGAAAVLGVVVGLPALRIRGNQLAVVTLGLAVAVERFVFRNPALAAGGDNTIEPPTFLGIDLAIREGRTIARLEFALLVVAVVVIVFVAVGNVARGPTGRRFLAVRSDERAAAAVGVNVAATKLTAFALSSFLAGVGGTLIGYSRGQLSADSFTVFVGLSILTFAYLGGITSMSGALIAGMFAPLGIGFVVLNRQLDVASWYLLLSGVGLILTAIFNPSGIAGANHELGQRLRPMVSYRSQALAGQAAARADRAQVDRIGSPVLKAMSEAGAKGGGAGNGGSGAANGPADVGPGAGRRVFRSDEIVLRTGAVTVSFAGLTAVDRASLEVYRGEIVGLIGANGAGKTTLLDAVGGFVPYRGTIEVGGRVVDGLAPHRRARAGLGRTWQSIQPFDDLTVAENLWVAGAPAAWWSPLGDIVRPGGTEPPPSVTELLQLTGLEAAADHHPPELSLGRQRVVGLARALASQPSVVLLDEPAAGLDETARQRLVQRVVDIVNRNTAVLVIDHDMGFMFDVCDRIYVLDFGRVIAEGSPAEVRGDETVVSAYLGTAR